MQDINQSLARTARALIVSAAAVMVLSGCIPKEYEEVTGDGIEVDLLIFFQDTTTDLRIESFIRTVLADVTVDGIKLKKGIAGISASVTVSGHKSLAVDFFPNVSEEERRTVIAAARASPDVRRVITNVIPGAVTHLGHHEKR